MPAPKRRLTDEEATARVLTTLASLSGIQGPKQIAQAAGVGPKQTGIALAELKRRGQVDHWPGIHGYKLSDLGLTAAGVIAANVVESPWKWQNGIAQR